MGTAAGLSVRRMTPTDLEMVRGWADGEGWNPGQGDAAIFHAADPTGFFLGELDGVPISSVSLVAYDSQYGFLGLYIVRPEFRGRGYGMATWREAIAYAGNRNVGLDGVVAQQDNYRKSGFRLAYQNLRYAAVGGGEAVPGIVPIASVPFEALQAYDRRHFPAARPTFLRRWLDATGATALAAVGNGSLSGYGVVRPAAQGFRIGPLFAEHLETADALYRSLLAAVPGQPVYIDVPDESVNPNAGKLVRRHGLASLFPTARMYTRETPDIAMQNVYGVTSLELG